jgi:hypothetical protein
MTCEELGKIKREFKPGRENLIAGIIIGLLLIGAGCTAVFFSIQGVVESGGALPFWLPKGKQRRTWGDVGLLGALGVGLLIGGFFLIRWVRSLFSFRVRIGHNGFSVTDQKTTQVIAWEEIESVHEIHVYERPPVLKGVAKYALPKMLSKSFIVTIKERESFEFDGNTIKKHLTLAQMIKEETDRRNIPWEIVE